MVTGDNFVTAKSIAAECGIYTPGGIALDVPTFRRLTSARSISSCLASRCSHGRRRRTRGVWCRTYVAFVGGAAFETEPLTSAQWGWSILFRILSIPLGVLTRLVPDDVFRAAWNGLALPIRFLRSLLSRLLSTSEREQPASHQASSRSVVSRVRAVVNSLTGRAGYTPSSTHPSRDKEGIAMADVSHDPFDLDAAMHAAQHHKPNYPVDFKIHPDTKLEDLVLDREARKVGVPPSQDPKLAGFMGIALTGCRGTGVCAYKYCLRVCDSVGLPLS